MKKGLLISVIFFSLLVHGGFLYFLHDLAIGPGMVSLDKSAFLATVDREQKALEDQRRNLALAEIFRTLSQDTPSETQTSRTLDSLKEEWAPSTSHFSMEKLPLGGEEAETTLSEILTSPSSLAIEPPASDSLEGFFVGKQATPLLTPQFDDTALSRPGNHTFQEPPSFASGALASSDHFNIQVEYAPKQNRPGYVFKLTFTPKKGVAFKRIRQNFLFLIDRSNSIPKARYALNKQAVAAALHLLQPGDSFNILIFDDKVVRLSPYNLPWNEESVTSGITFLEKQGHGGLLAATDLYTSLGKIIPKKVSDLEANIAILLSDGDTYLSLEHQRQTIGNWTAENRGKVSLFSLASGNGNNLSLLELISKFNKGVLVHTSDHSLVEEKLSGLMLSLQNPIGKGLIATAVTCNKHSIVTLQPKNTRLPDLYQHRPYVLYGSTNRLADFTIFLQGKYYGKDVDIKKTISFAEARLGTPFIEKQWTQLLAQEYFENFFRDGKQSHLDAAKQLLTPLNLTVPFLGK